MPELKKLPSALGAASLVLSLAFPWQALHADAAEEQAQADLLAFIGGVHLSSTITALVPEPLTALVAEGVALTSNLSLKALRPALLAPGDRAVFPNSADQCTYDFDLPQADHLYSNVYGFELKPVPEDWGALGTPDLYHYGSEVVLGVHNRLIRPSVVPNRAISFPAGTQTIDWRAQTLLDPGFDVALPTVMLAMSYSKFKAAKLAPAAVADDGATVAKEVGIFRKAGEFLVDKFRLGIAKGVDEYINYVVDSNTGWEIGTASTEQQQLFTVYDVRDPVLSYLGENQVDRAVLPPLTIEATDIGGVKRERIASQLEANFTAFDPCDRTASIRNDLPELLSIGANEVVWTATDPGPTFAGGGNTVEAFQTIIVADTQGPLMVPPPGKVIEVDPAGPDANGLALAAIDLGVPRVVDLADPAPRVQSDAPAFFPTDSRTAVQWTATDQSENSSAGAQLITVKTLGSNTAPVVQDVGAQTLTSQPVDIVLRGSDSDQIGGVFDPLAIEITSRPANGEFVAPLLPFFISDYRSSVTGPFGPDFGNAANPFNWMFDNVCANPDFADTPADSRIPIDWPYKPKFLHVEDEGDYYLIDEVWSCDMAGSRARTRPRLSKWNQNNEFLGQAQYGGTTDTFVADQDSFLYQLSLSGGQGSSAKLLLEQRLSNIEDSTSFGTTFSGDRWIFDSSSTSNPNTGVQHFLDTGKMAYARIDSRRGLMYLSDKNRVFVFDVRADLADGVYDSYNPRTSYLGALRDGDAFLCQRTSGNSGGDGAGFAIDVDSEGALYVMNGCDQRIHKFAPSYFGADGELVFGEHIGWLGRCESSTNNACDTENKRSRGYSCTNETCQLNDRNTNADGSTTDGARGSDPGQFSSPSFFDLDPNDVLYVADLGRVQRFARDGTFGGQAKSTGTGINQGDRPGFILGNMGVVKAVTVNSNRFYVVDTAESFVHEFETTPLKDITDNSATVTYVSNLSFHGQTDSFTYTATDGLAESNVGTVSVQVDRNFRAPEAFSQSQQVLEDGEVQLVLTGDDPDGVIGTDDVFPLDTLTYRVVEAPVHGTASLTGDQLTYTPDPDYHGTDSLQFVANDGREDSPPATVTVTVLPVDDNPILKAPEMPDRIARGYPTLVTVEFTDDGRSDAPDYWVDWGDGSRDNAGDFVDPDGPDGPADAELVGVKLTEAPGAVGPGNLVAAHTFSTDGIRTVSVCLATRRDEPQCVDRVIEVETLIDFDVRYEEPVTETDEGFIDLQLTVQNTIPNAGPPYGTAINTRIISLPSQDLRVDAAFVDSEFCAVNADALDCLTPELPVAYYIGTNLRVRPKTDGPLIYDLEAPFVIEVSSDTQALENTYTKLLWLTFTADATDSDGDGMSDVFESAFGLNPASAADATVDSDGDGLSNLEEFEARLDPTTEDTDGDTIPDAIDICPLDPNGSADFDQDGLCEAVQDLDPVERSRLLRLIPLLEQLSPSS